MGFRLVQKSVTLNDLEWHNNHSQVAAVYPFGLSWGYYHQRNNITVCDLRFTVRQPTNGIYVYADKLFVHKLVFYVVLFELMVKKFTIMSFVTIIG